MGTPPHSPRPAATEPASFPQFAQLPAELRRKIWRRALPRRPVHLRLKMDMNAWNWATEGDWWTHYRVAADPFPVASAARALYNGDGDGDGDGDDAGPALLRVSVEARAEALHAYRRRLALDPATLQRCLETAAGGRDDAGTAAAPEKDAQTGPARRGALTQQPGLLTRMCAPAGMPRFDARRDVLVWAGIRRWCSAGGLGSSNGRHGATAASTLCALFEATCRAARHVVVEYDARLDGPLRALARAVADPGTALLSLTLQTAAPETTRGEPHWRGDFRVVAAVPRRVVVVLPPRRPDAGPARQEEEEEEEEEENDEHGAEAAALLRRHHVVFLPSAPPVPEGGFVVLAVVTPGQLAAIASRCHPTSMGVFMDSTLAHTFAGTLTAAQRTTGGTGDPEAVVARGAYTIQSFHGFCDPEYGLP